MQTTDDHWQRQMRTFKFILLLAITSGAFAFPCAARSFPPPDTLPPKATGSYSTTETESIRRARDFAGLLSSRDYAGCVEMFDKKLRDFLPMEKLKVVWESLQNQHGKYKDAGLPPTCGNLGEFKVVLLPSRFGLALLDLKVTLNQSNEVSGFFIVPHKVQSSDSLSQSESFTESRVQVGSGDFALDGTWTIPKTSSIASFPCLVLVHGSGPQDRDETMGTNKPFKDIAHGLAERGVAVLRYEKRTRQHPESLKMKETTVNEETVNDAVEAARVAASLPSADPRRVFVLGHSLGGMVLPRIMRKSDIIKGGICMAAPARPFGEILLEQYEYIASLKGQNAESARMHLPKLREEVARLKVSNKPAEDGELPLSLPAAYWNDLRSYSPIDDMAQVNKPVLFLQGDRDYQVTTSGDFQLWKSLAERNDGKKESYTYKQYANLNHLFAAGEGKATPEEYMTQTKHVDPRVLDDIASWIKGLN